jgi:DNA polymerase III subunit alpha
VRWTSCSRPRGNTPFASLTDFTERVDLRELNRRGLECLIKVGALDDFGPRGRLMAAIDAILSASANAHAAAEAGQMSLFGPSSSDSAVMLPTTTSSPPCRAAGPGHPKESWNGRKELVGVYVSSHPLQQMTVDLQNVITHATVDITEELKGTSVVVAGLIADVRTITTKKGETMAFIKLEDLQGAVDLTVFPQLFKERRDLWTNDKIVVIWGKADFRNGRVSVVADQAQDYVEGMKIIEDTTSVYHRYQYGQDDDFDYPPDNPFANQAPDWLMEAGATYIAPAPAVAPVEETLDAGPDSARSAEAPAPSSDNKIGKPLETTEPVAPTLPVQPVAALPAAATPIAQPSPGPKTTRLLVTFRRSHSLEGDRQRLGDLVDLLERHRGADRFVIIVEAPGQPRYQLDFPNSTTRICQELKNELSQRLGAGYWRVE